MKRQRTVTAADLQRLTEDQLGEQIRTACEALGWRFIWLRKTFNSSNRNLDLLLIPLCHFERRHTLHRELKGFDRRGRLGQLTPAQSETIHELMAAGDDAKKWEPADWFNGTILEELK